MKPQASTTQLLSGKGMEDFVRIIDRHMGHVTRRLRLERRRLRKRKIEAYDNN